MKETLENLWNEYFLGKCAEINTDEERSLTKKAAELCKKANATLNSEQKSALEEYIRALCDIDAIFAKKAFLKGCEFSVSFILEAESSKK